MSDRVREPMTGRRGTIEIPVAAPQGASPTVAPDAGLQQDQSDSQVPQLPSGFVVVDRGSGLKVWDVRSGDVVDADDLATDPDGTTVMSGNLILKGGSIASDNFVEGSAGWEITHDGNAELNNVALRGQLIGLDGTNMLTNPDAEGGVTTGWAKFPTGGTLTTSATHVHSGSLAFLLQSDNTGPFELDMYTSPKVSGLVPGEVYRASGWAYTTSADATYQMSIIATVYDSSNNVLEASTLHVVMKGSTWTPLSQAFVAPDDADSVEFKVNFVRCDNDLFANGEGVWLDDLFFGPASDLVAGLIATASEGPHLELAGSDITIVTNDPAEHTPATVYGAVTDSTANRRGILVLQPPDLGSSPSTSAYINVLSGTPSGGDSELLLQADSIVLGTEPPLVQKVFCKAQQTSAQTIPSSGGPVTALALNGTDVDDDLSMHSPSVNNTRITVPYTGLYSVTGQVWFTASNLGSMRGACIQVNGTTKVWENRQTNAQHATASPSVEVTGPIFLNAGDYVEMLVYQDTAANLNTLIVASRGPFLAVGLLHRTA